MAVEKSKVIARLKALFPKANLSQKRLDAYADKLAKKPADDADDATIDAIINDYNEVIDFVGVAVEDDRIRTLESKANPPAPTPPAPTPTPDPKPTDDVNKKLLYAITKLTGEVEAIKTGKTIETKRQTASELFGKSEVLKNMKPELKAKWEKRIDIDSETSFEDQITELESEYSELVQISADNNQYAGPAGGGSSAQKPDQAIVDEIVNNLNI